MPTPSPTVYRKIPEGHEKWPWNYTNCPSCGAIKSKASKLLCRACQVKEKASLIEQPSDPSYRFIPLTRGQHAIVDVENYEDLIKWNWFAAWSKGGRTFYAKRSVNLSNGQNKAVFMHRQIMGLGEDDEIDVDHAFHNTLDNRKYVDGKENLRLATRAENMHNGKIRKNNTTGFKGVCKTKWGFAADICVNGKRIHLGKRPTAELAYTELYVPAANLYFGKFAKV
jgi:hypothetical protein